MVEPPLYPVSFAELHDFAAPCCHIVASGPLFLVTLACISPRSHGTPRGNLRDRTAGVTARENEEAGGDRETTATRPPEINDSTTARRSGSIRSSGLHPDSWRCQS